MIRNKEDLRHYIKEDTISLGIKKQSFIRNFLFPDPIYKFQKTLRKLEYYTNCKTITNRILWLYYKIKYRKLSLKLGFSIPINVFDSGLSIAHYGTIVVNPNARIGKNCRIHACVNIGASAGFSEAPTIGDNVYIGPGALLFGDIIIANNTTIGANATVNKSSTETNVVLAGVPAKVVKTGFPDWTIFNHRSEVKTSFPTIC